MDYVSSLMPKEIRKRRKIQSEDGVSVTTWSSGLGDNGQVIFPPLFAFKSDAGWEEYTDYVFNDDEAAQPSLKILAMAKKWKQTNESS